MSERTSKLLNKYANLQFQKFVEKRAQQEGHLIIPPVKENIRLAGMADAQKRIRAWWDSLPAKSRASARKSMLRALRGQ